MRRCHLGYNDADAGRLIFDLETAPLPDAAEYLEPASAPGNYKDPDKIAAYIADANAKNLEQAGLDVDLGQIVAIGWWWEGQEAEVCSAAYCTERDMLKQFWAVAEGRHLVGYNVLAFDLPFLFRRSLYLGVPTPFLQIEKYRHPQVTDLQDVLSFQGKLKWRGLSFYCRKFGVDIPDDLTGADIAAAVQAGEWGKVESHVRCDILKTAALAEKLGHFTRAVRQEAVL